MIFSTLDSKVNEIAGVCDDSAQSLTEGVFNKGGDFGLGQRLCKPLHVVLHENLNRRATDPRTAVNGRCHSSDRRNMGAKKGKKPGGFFWSHEQG